MPECPTRGIYSPQKEEEITIIIQSPHGLLNVFMEPKLQSPGGQDICTVQIEKYEDVVGLGSRLGGEIRFKRYSMFPFTGYASRGELTHILKDADWKSLGMHQGEFSPDPVAYEYLGWYEDDREEEEFQDSDSYFGYVFPEDREDFRFTFERTLHQVIFYPVFTMPKELVTFS